MSVTPRAVPGLSATAAAERDEELATILALLPAAAGEHIRALLQRGWRHEARLQQLQQITASLSRTLDEDDIASELARGVQRAIRCDGVVIAHVDLDRSLVEVVRHVVGDTQRPLRTTALGNGALAEAARTGAPVLVTPYDAACVALAACDDVVAGAGPTGAVLAVPMMHGRRLLGVVAVHDAAEDAFDDEAREVLVTLAASAAGALCNARLFADSERERRQSNAMAEIAHAVGESLRMGEVLRLILRHAVALLQAEGACVALRNDAWLHVVSSFGIADLLRGVHLPVSGSLSGRVVATGAAMVTNDIASEPGVHRPTLRLVAVQKAVIVPLVTARGIIGVLSVYNRPLDFDGDDARVLQRLADQVAVAIVNARLFEEVQEATREWLAAFESIGVGMCIVDEGGKIMRFNRRALQLAGEEAPRTLVGRPFYETLLGRRPDEGEDPLGRALVDMAQSRAICTGADGRALDIVAAPHPAGAIVSFDDIAAHRAVAGGAPTEATQSPPEAIAQERYRRLLDLTGDVVLSLDSDGAITSASKAFCAAVGTREGDVVGRTLQSFVDEGDAERVAGVVRDALGGEPRAVECGVVRRGGGGRLLALSVSPVEGAGEDGAVAGALVVGRDVTGERVRAESPASGEACHTDVVQGVPEAILMLDEEGRFTAVNRAFERATGRRHDDVVGHPFTTALDPADHASARELFAGSLRGERQRGRIRWAASDGAVQEGSLVASPIRHGRRVVGVLVVVRQRHPRIVGPTHTPRTDHGRPG